MPIQQGHFFRSPKAYKKSAHLSTFGKVIHDRTIEFDVEFMAVVQSVLQDIHQALLMELPTVLFNTLTQLNASPDATESSTLME